MPNLRAWVSKLKMKPSSGSHNRNQDLSNSRPSRRPAAIQAIFDNQSTQNLFAASDEPNDMVPHDVNEDDVRIALAMLITTDSLPDEFDPPSKFYIQCMYEKESNGEPGKSCNCNSPFRLTISDE